MNLKEKEGIANTLADLTLEMFERCNLKLERMAKSMNLKVAEFKTLNSFKSDTTLTAGDLARRMELSNSRLTKIMDGLVEKGIVRRELSLKDRRVMEIQLTSEGEEVVKKLKEKYTVTHLEILDNLPDQAGDSIIYAMQKLITATRKWEEN